MKKNILTFLSTVFLLTATAYSQESKSSDVQFAPDLTTIFPIFLGAGGKVIFSQHYELTAHYGFTPQSYYKTIASVGAKIAGNDSYKDIIEAAFQNNSLFRIGFQYNFDTPKSGWNLGLAFYRLKSSGKAGVQSVLYAATGANYTNLETALRNAGKSTEVDMESTLNIAEISFGYGWEFNQNWTAGVKVGAAKVTQNNVTLTAGLPIFDNTNLKPNAESEMESIISQYGVSPVISANVSYVF